MLQVSLPYRSVYTPLSFLSSMFWTLHKSYFGVPVPTSAYTDDSTSTYIYHTLHSIHSHIWAHSRPQNKASGFDTTRSCKYIHGQSNIHYTSQFFLALIYFMANQIFVTSNDIKYSFNDIGFFDFKKENNFFKIYLVIMFSMKLNNSRYLQCG